MEEIIYILGQALGFVAVILGFVNYQVKTREQVLYVHIATTIVFAIHFLCLKEYATAVMQLVGTTRNIVFYNKGKNGKVSKGVAIFFALLMGTLGSITMFALQKGEWFAVIAIVGLVINSYAMSFSNPNNVRKSILVSSPLVFTYDVLVHSIGGALYEAIVIVSSVIGLIRYSKKTQKTEENEEK
ncbi:MAG: YgjV family protein [Acutalibacteraceae bacterium]|nr:YgjV family protein [Acutalibacteraceae bacterium]